MESLPHAQPIDRPPVDRCLRCGRKGRLLGLEYMPAQQRGREVMHVCVSSQIYLRGWWCRAPVAYLPSLRAFRNVVQPLAASLALPFF
jgi:hypothetical protein